MAFAALLPLLSSITDVAGSANKSTDNKTIAPNPYAKDNTKTYIIVGAVLLVVIVILVILIKKKK